MPTQLLIAALIALTSVTATLAQKSDIIDNKKLLELKKLNLGDELIINLIQSSERNFTCDLESILQLKKDSIGEKVIAEVLKYCTNKKSSTVEESNIHNPTYHHPSGIYILDSGKMRKVYPTVFSESKSGGFGNALAASITSGLAKAGAKMALNGSTANVQSSIATEYYFYFEQDKETTSLTNWYFSKAVSPNEFTLIWLDKNKTNRELKFGKGNKFSTQIGIDDSYKVQFSFEEIKPGIFKVVPKTALRPGEYCFMYSANSATTQTQFANDRVFDFSIQEPPKVKRR